MKSARNNWRNKVIIQLGNPNYKAVFAPTREKSPGGKWRVAGLELHIYDTGEEDPSALPKEHHLKENVINPTRNAKRTTVEASAPRENNFIDTTILREDTKASSSWGDTLSSALDSLAHQRSSSPALASQRPVYLKTTTEHTRECISTYQSAPLFHDSTTLPAIEVSTSLAQSKQRVSHRKKSPPSSHFASVAPLPKSAETHLPRTVAPVRPPRGTIHPAELDLPSANISTPTPHTPAPHIIKTEPESEPVPAPTSDSFPEWALPQPSPRRTKPSEPTQFESSFCSGSNAVESLSDIARGFLRRYVCAAFPFVLLTVQRFFGYLESTEKARILGGYSEEALMSWQLNDLPTIGVCPQVGNPQAQGHQITEVPRWVERNLLRTSHTLLHDIYLSTSTVLNRRTQGSSPCAWKGRYCQALGNYGGPHIIPFARL